jgi:hypothetical protein
MCSLIQLSEVRMEDSESAGLVACLVITYM